MNGFILSATHNKPGRNDAIGAFQVGANAFSRIYGLPKYLFDNRDEGAVAQADVLKKMKDQPGNWDVLAYFGHGDWDAMSSAGFYHQKGAEKFANAIWPQAKQRIKVLLYACNTGLPGGFASWLAGYLKGKRAQVYAHEPPAGHSFKCPRVRVYGDGYPAKGQLIFESTSWLYSEWIAALSEERSDLWARYPWMSQTEIEKELLGPEFLIGRWEVKSKQSTWNNVFFADGTALFTGEKADKFAIYDSGKWKATSDGVMVYWNGGNTDFWAESINKKKYEKLFLHPELKVAGQKVQPSGGGLPYTARRIESPTENARGRFFVKGVTRGRPMLTGALP